MLAPAEVESSALVGPFQLNEPRLGRPRAVFQSVGGELVQDQGERCRGIAGQLRFGPVDLKPGRIGRKWCDQERDEFPQVSAIETLSR